MICDIPNCQRHQYAKGLCNMHWQRSRNGAPMTAALLRAPAGAGSTRPDGYRLHRVGGRRRYAHIEVAERALGKRLPTGAQVHHVNGDPSDNSTANLVICPDRAYHALLHRRADALAACGQPDWRICVYCGKYAPENELRRHGPRSFRHRHCKFRAAA